MGINQRLNDLLNQKDEEIMKLNNIILDYKNAEGGKEPGTS